MPKLPDDPRTASGIFTTLSGQLMAGAFAILGIQAAIVGLIVDRKSPSPFFVLALICSLVVIVLIIASVYQGGRGISELARAGYNGNWTLDPKYPHFRFQKVFMIAATLALYFSVAFGVLAPTRSSEDVVILQTRVSQLEAEVTKLQTHYNRHL